MAEAYLVQKSLEDLLLRVVLFHFPRGCLLAKLSAERAIGPVDDVRMHVADEKLRYRAGPPALPENIVLDRSSDSDDVNAIMLVEALILDRDERLRHVLRERSKRHARAYLGSNFTDERS